MKFVTKIIQYIFVILLLQSCGVSVAKDGDISINGNFYNRDGSCKFNLGHRLGGDFKEYKDNNPANIAHVSTLQNHECFKNWEFDLRPTKDGKLISFHDHYYRGERVERWNSKRIKAATLEQILSEFGKHSIYKPIAIDVKKLMNERQVSHLLSTALRHMLAHNNQIKIVTYCKHKGNPLYESMMSKAQKLGMIPVWIKCEGVHEYSE